MGLRCSKAVLVCALFVLFSSCGQSPPQAARAATVSPTLVSGAHAGHEIRLAGTVRAVHFFTVQVPQIMGENARVTLTRLIANGVHVKAGDLLAEFDRTLQLDNAREAEAKFEDLAHQVDQRVAQNRADAAKRESELQKAEADLAKAELQLRKGPLLSEIDRLKNETKAEDARAHVASLHKSDAFHDQADSAAVHILELQRDRQKVSLDRARANADKLAIRATLGGMVALENVWRNGSMGKAQDGDQLWPGQPLIRIFDPSEMEVLAQVGEPDDAVLAPDSRAIVHLDAYPDLALDAHFVSASQVASSALGSPIKTFTARFRLEKSDPHLLPDLSAAVVLESTPGAAGGKR